MEVKVSKSTEVAINNIIDAIKELRKTIKEENHNSILCGNFDDSLGNLVITEDELLNTELCLKALLNIKSTHYKE